MSSETPSSACRAVCACSWEPCAFTLYPHTSARADTFFVKAPAVCRASDGAEPLAADAGVGNDAPRLSGSTNSSSAESFAEPPEEAPNVARRRNDAQAGGSGRLPPAGVPLLPLAVLRVPKRQESVAAGRPASLTTGTAQRAANDLRPAPPDCLGWDTDTWGRSADACECQVRAQQATQRF